MNNTSATGGYLAPTSAPISDDDVLDIILQGVVTNIVGLPGNLVRPRWQNPIPEEPEQSVNWCSIGVVSEDEPDQNSILRHFGMGDGFDETQENVDLYVMASFYGSNARTNARLLSIGIMIPQNRDQLFFNSMGLISKPEPILMVPELINNVWRHKADLQFKVRWQLIRTWPVKNLLRVVGTLTTDDKVEPFDTDNARKSQI